MRPEKLSFTVTLLFQFKKPGNLISASFSVLKIFSQKAHIILCRLYHKNLPTKERLHSIVPHYFTDPRCILCGNVEIGKRLLWGCIHKRSIWQNIASSFLDNFLSLIYEFIEKWRLSALAILPVSIEFQEQIACTVLSLWQTYWKHICDSHPFWPDEVAARATCTFRRIARENLAAA